VRLRAISGVPWRGRDRVGGDALGGVGAEVAEPNLLPRISMDEAGAFVHVTRPPGREGADHRAELASLVGQLVLRPRGMVGVEAPAHDALLLPELEPLREDAGREGGP